MSRHRHARGRAQDGATDAAAASGVGSTPGASGRIARWIVLALGALVFLFPFYYMVIGSLQTKPDPTPAGAFPNPANITLQNYVEINERISLLSGLVNSGIFTGGVILCTVVFGVLAGYALSVLHWRGRGVTFSIALLVQIVPFQLLMIPLYVLIARDYGLADTHLGMILPFAINSAAVLIFRQYFLQVPRALFDAARIDGASELRVLWSVALPLVRPALLTVVLLTFIGPWNEFLWPFLITKEASMQPLAVSLANYITTVAASRVQSVRRDPGRCGRARHPGGRAVRHLPAPVPELRHRLGGQGMTAAGARLPTVPYTLTRVGVVMTPEEGNPLEVEGVLNPASGRGPDGELLPAAAAGRRGQRLARRSRPGRRGGRRAGRRRAAGRRARARPLVGTGHRQRRGRRSRASRGWPISICT